ncbi:uncharacterized protein LOC8276159 isoform X2 [Ricinus communis]|uniref:uncharacterized protein LOC8276159 isoform X2 n=1 Tax=Ricinus communis TaxID=3988 RepID=UPI0007729758|nr:uncharacterized protein LOC8276159 isoform X2 [Ricinus communis]|eukprot:XP_015580941.1 uncharacterized protein LOC8276159 isoform X2 [Ricinus communis]
MAFASFVGRVLFASVFILSAWQEFNDFGVDGGPAAKSFAPKFNVFSRHVSSNTGFQVPPVELLHQAVVTPILYDFYNYDADKKEFHQLFTKFTQNLALFGALLFFIGMKNSIPRRQLKKKTPKSKTM